MISLDTGHDTGRKFFPTLMLSSSAVDIPPCPSPLTGPGLR
jgi:hypothetical protein